MSNIKQTLSVPGDIFVAGYNLGLLAVGENTIPTTAKTIIEGTNTAEGTQTTDTASSAITTTISDPDGTPSTGDESGADGMLSLAYADQTWTAGTSPGTIDFREDTVDPISASAGGTGGIVIAADVGGIITVTFACSPGTVDTDPPAPPEGVTTFDDPATSFASTRVEGTPLAAEISFGKPKLDKKKGTAKLPVEVPGAGKLKLKQTSKVKGASKSTKGAGTVKLTVKARGKAKKDLKKRGKSKVTVSVTFTPEVGEPVTKLKKLTLKKKR